jgi:hypothetical protein
MLSPRALACASPLGLHLCSQFVRLSGILKDYRIIGERLLREIQELVFGVIGLPEKGQAGRAIACSAQRLVNQRSAPQDIFAEIGAT